MSPTKSLFVVFLIITSLNLRCSQGGCGDVRFKCNTPGDPACCEGICCQFFHLYNPGLSEGDTLIITNPNPSIIDTIPNGPIQAEEPSNADLTAPIYPMQPILEPIRPIKPIKPVFDLCLNSPSCPCLELQCFERRIPPLCDCDCPLDILEKEQTINPNIEICGIDNPGQIYNRDSCSCSCPVGSNNCNKHQIFNTKTCECDTKEIPPPKPIDPAPPKILPIEPIIAPLPPKEPIIAPLVCPKLHEECTSALEREHRCCDGQSGGTTKCNYSGEDLKGNKIGKCCVRNKRSGCSVDADCCKSDGWCSNGICRRNKHRSFAAKNIEGEFDNFEMIKDEKDSKFVAISVPTVAIIFVIVLLLFPILYYVYYRKVIVKKMKQSVRREIFHGLEINNHSDDEFADSEDEEQYVD